jgi:peptide/nickel transport system ATP-binding protein
MGVARPGCRIVQGAVLFDGVDITTASSEHNRLLRGSRIAYVAQSAAAAFNPTHKLLDQTTEVVVRRGLQDRTVAQADARELYRILQLPEPNRIGDRYPHQVSGGQLQRVMTAMAMSPRPDLIVFDEPTTALDVTTQVEVLAAIRDIVERFNTSAIYITHDLAVVAQMADRIMVLRHGEVVEEASTADVLSSPRHDYTKSLWAVRSLETPERATADVVLSLTGIEASYKGNARILSNIDIKVPRGRTVAVVGESGSGKSTVARVIAGLLPPTSGEVRLNGDPLPPFWRQRSLDQLRRIQMIYQAADTSLNPRLTVREIIGRPLSLYFNLGRSALSERRSELMSMIELDDRLLDRLPGELSGGQKQRICIARALAASPDFVICDEVTSALDQIVQESILKLLRRLQEQLNITYLFITHDIAAVRAMADDIVVMHGGRIVEQGSKSAVLNPPYEPYTELLLSSVPEMDPQWLNGVLLQRKSGGTPAAIEDVGVSGEGSGSSRQ